MQCSGQNLDFLNPKHVFFYLYLDCCSDCCTNSPAWSPSIEFQVITLDNENVLVPVFCFMDSRREVIEGVDSRHPLDWIQVPQTDSVLGSVGIYLPLCI